MEEQETVVSVVNECDNCSEQNKGYDRAIETLEREAQHLRNLSLEDTVVQAYYSAVEILRKER